MNPTIKQSLFGLFLGVPGLLICCGTMYFISAAGPLENPSVFWAGIWISCNFVVLCWVLIVFKKPSRNFDERDMTIYKQAVLIAFSLMWVYFVTASCIFVGTMVLWGIYRPIYYCWLFSVV